MINQRYRIKKQLGKGRSTVYLCVDLELPGTEIAIKILPVDVEPFEVQVFRDEFFTLQKLNHPNIIKSFDYGTILRINDEDKNVSVGSKFFTLEYYNGEELLSFDSAINESALKEILKQLCSVLYYLHLSNYIYYDLKPENILVSIINDKPVIKLIDLGFAQYIIGNSEGIIRGTAEYIAPEILKNAKHDYRVDFYSLGILLYRIIYGRFPFDTKSELEIYKAHVENEFDFPPTIFSNEIIDVIKKLVKKDPDERYANSIQILFDLKIPVTEELYQYWIPAKVFADRKDFLTILKTYVADSKSIEVFSVNGSEGAGKTALSYEIYSNYENSIFIDNTNAQTGIEFVRSLLKKIIFNNEVYPKLSKDLLNQIDRFYESQPENFDEGLKSIFNRLSSECGFILILDGFNNYDLYTLELFKNIIPILQVNHIKVILTENSDRHSASDFIFNLQKINLTPFTEAHLSEYLDKSFSAIFPKNELRQLILSYGDLLPGNLESFLKDVILLKIIEFTPDGVEISTDEKSISLLKGSHEEFYGIRLNNLTEHELNIAQFISMFDILIDQNVIEKFFNIHGIEVQNLLERLHNKNIIHRILSNASPVFTAESLKKYTYSLITDKSASHKKTAKFLKQNFPNFNRTELAHQFELADEFEESYHILKEELFQAEKTSSFAYQKNILQHLLNFPLSPGITLDVNFEYCKALTRLNEYPQSLTIIDEILQEKIEAKLTDELLILKAKCLMGSGEPLKAKNLLESLVPKFEELQKRNLLLLDIATINLNLNLYNEAYEICRQIIEKEISDSEIKGQSHQMMGLVAIYRDDDLNTALKDFENAETVYEKGGYRFRQAQILMNIGNIYSMKGDEKNAVVFWNKSLDINKSIGNIQQEAKLLLNFGIYYYNDLEIERSLESYLKALAIFSSLEIKDGLGLVKSNLGEIFSLTCDYQKALDSLKEAVELFRQLQNKEEELQAMYLIGKLYFIIGDYEELIQLLGEYEYKIKEGESGEQHKINFQYLSTLSKYKSAYPKSTLESLLKIKGCFVNEERKHDYFSCAMLITNIMLDINMTAEAYEELHSEYLAKICSENLLFEAERVFMLGKLSEINSSLGLKSSIDYYQSAYELINDSHVTELTWKILYSLSIFYSKRGNINKEKEFVKYTKSLLYFISENINNSRIRNIYLEEPKRKEALTNLNLLEAQL